MKEEKKHILIIDDEEGIREPLKEYLESENFFVTTAKDSQDAKNKIKILEFDLINSRYNDARSIWFRTHKRN